MLNGVEPEAGTWDDGVLAAGLAAGVVSFGEKGIMVLGAGGGVLVLGNMGA